MHLLRTIVLLFPRVLTNHGHHYGSSTDLDSSRRSSSDEMRTNRPPIGTVRIVPSLIRRRMVLVLTLSIRARSWTVWKEGDAADPGSASPDSGSCAPGDGGSSLGAPAVNVAAYAGLDVRSEESMARFGGGSTCSRRLWFGDRIIRRSRLLLCPHTWEVRRSRS